MLDIRVVDPAISGLSSLQVDRLTEFFEEVGAYVPYASRLLRERDRKCARLSRALRSLQSKEENLANLLSDAEAKLRKARRHFESSIHLDGIQKQADRAKADFQANRQALEKLRIQICRLGIDADI